MLSESLLQELITCHKIPLKADRRKPLLENRHYKNSIILKSKDEKYEFKMFIRQSEDFNEDFSIGLIWTNPFSYINISKNIILLRCQGPHDGKSPVGSDGHHSYHTHTITLEDIQNRRYTKPSKRELTDEFNSFDQALLYFIKKCTILGLENYIDIPYDDDNEQITMF